MNFFLSYKDKKIEVPCDSGDTVAVYVVPKAYVSDGFYCAVWRSGSEIEPFPASDKHHQIAKVLVQEAQGVASVNGFLEKGVTAYAEN